MSRRVTLLISVRHLPEEYSNNPVDDGRVRILHENKLNGHDHCGCRPNRIAQHTLVGVVAVVWLRRGSMPELRTGRNTVPPPEKSHTAVVWGLSAAVSDVVSLLPS